MRMSALWKSVYIIVLLFCGHAKVGLAAYPGDMASGADVAPPGTALVYVIQGGTGNFAHALVYLDGRMIERLREKTYLVMAVGPGSHEISTAGSERAALTLDVKLGDSYYVKQTINARGIPEMRSLSETEGRQAVAQSRAVRDGVVDPSASTRVATRQFSNEPANGFTKSRFYFGVGAGPGRVKGLRKELNQAITDLQTTSDDLFGPGTVTVSGNADDTVVGGKLFLGYNVNRFLSVEGSYTGFDKVKARLSATDGVDTISEKDSWEISGIGLAGVGKLPISRRFALFGKAGMFHWEVRYKWTIDETVTPSIDSGGASHSGMSPFFGVGGQVQVSDNFGIRAELERYMKMGKEDVTGRYDVDMISLSAVFNF